MLKRLTALVFILALGAGALASAPLHACDHECDMHKAVAAGESGCAASHAAKAEERSKPAPRALACGDCLGQGQSQAPATTAQKAPQPVSADQHSAPAPKLPPVAGAVPHVSQSLSHHPSSKPAFIRHHALLI